MSTTIIRMVTFYWIAPLNTRDGAHTIVMEFSRSAGFMKIVTTQEVLTEYLNFYSEDPQLREVAALAVQEVLSARNVEVVPQSQTSIFIGLDLYKLRSDKGYSLTDCISMQTMRRLQITDVPTNDHHFQQEEFRALFRDGR